VRPGRPERRPPRPWSPTRGPRGGVRLPSARSIRARTRSPGAPIGSGRPASRSERPHVRSRRPGTRPRFDCTSSRDPRDRSPRSVARTTGCPRGLTGPNGRTGRADERPERLAIQARRPSTQKRRPPTQMRQPARRAEQPPVHSSPLLPEELPFLADSSRLDLLTTHAHATPAAPTSVTPRIAAATTPLAGVAQSLACPMRNRRPTALRAERARILHAFRAAHQLPAVTGQPPACATKGEV
jgi:hypothetical protein